MSTLAEWIAYQRRAAVFGTSEETVLALLDVAEAAEKMRRIGGCVLLPGGNDGCPCSICEATRAFDAAASGEGRG